MCHKIEFFAILFGKMPRQEILLALNSFTALLIIFIAALIIVT